MKINETTLLFEDLTDVDRDELLCLCRRIVLKGKSDMLHPLFTEWCKVAGFSDTQALLVHTTTFPQWALLSIVDK